MRQKPFKVLSFVRLEVQAGGSSHTLDGQKKFSNMAFSGKRLGQ
jgi:hypothetical protein